MRHRPLLAATLSPTAIQNTNPPTHADGVGNSFSRAASEGFPPLASPTRIVTLARTWTNSIRAASAGKQGRTFGSDPAFQVSWRGIGGTRVRHGCGCSGVVERSLQRLSAFGAHRTRLPCYSRNQCTSRARVLGRSRLDQQEARIVERGYRPSLHVSEQLVVIFYALSTFFPMYFCSLADGIF